jgi:hypothetical protein
MRSKGLLVWNTLSQIESAYVTFVDAVALDAIGYKYYIVYMPLVIIQWLLAYKCTFTRSVVRCCAHKTQDMVETKGYTLEEIATAFDGPSTSNVAILPAAEQPGYDDTIKASHSDVAK